MTRKTHILIIIALWSISAASVFLALKDDYNITKENYIAYGLLLMISIFAIWKEAISKVILFFILLIGSINLVSFTYVDYYFSFGLLNFQFIKIQPLSFFFLLIFIITNRGTIDKIFNTIKNYEK